MKITVWGCRGSLPSPSPENIEFGGHTSCVQITHEDTCVILDGGSGIQKLGASFGPEIKHINILLTHLHIDHIVGLGFFQPFYNPSININIWGPKGTNESLESRLRRYFSPPIFPVRLQDLPCQPIIHEVSKEVLHFGKLKITTEYVCHPGPTVAYRIETENSVVAYIPDHEPALCSANFPTNPEWTSGYSLAKNADILFHDGQYRAEEYINRMGWGHSSMDDAINFANLANVKKLLLFHHDPLHTDEQLHRFFKEAMTNRVLPFEVSLCAEGTFFTLP